MTNMAPKRERRSNQPASPPINSKYSDLAREFRRNIESGVWKVGDQIPGLWEISEQYGVAYMTARAAVSNLVDGGLLVRTRGKGTFVSTAQKQRTVPMLLVIPDELDRDDPHYLPDILQGFRETLAQSDSRVTIYSETDVDTIIALANEAAVACLLLGPEHSQLLEQLRNHGHRVLAINHYNGRRRIPSVRIADAEGAQAAVEYAASLGHRTIGVIPGPEHNLDAKERLQGIRTAVKRLNMTAVYSSSQGFTEQIGYVGAVEVINSKLHPSVIVCASDFSALGALRAARDHNISIPARLSIIGFGDFPMSQYMLPSLTTVKQPRMDLGREAARALLELASGETSESVVLKPQLVIRDSTGPAPNPSS